MQNTIRGVFFYLDRSHLLQTHSPTIHETAVNLFRTHIFGESALRGTCVEGAYDLLQADRHGSGPDTQLFFDSIRMFHELQVYTSDFEPRMLALSQGFVLDWSDTECEEKDLPNYVDASVLLMDAEMRRCKDFDLDRSTRNSLLTLLEDHIITRKEADLSKQHSWQFHLTSCLLIPCSQRRFRKRRAGQGSQDCDR